MFSVKQAEIIFRFFIFLIFFFYRSCKLFSFFLVSLHTKFEINSILYWRDKISNWNKQANFSKNSNKCNNTYLKSCNDITQQCIYSVYYTLTLTRFSTMHKYMFVLLSCLFAVFPCLPCIALVGLCHEIYWISHVYNLLATTAISLLLIIRHN